MASAIRPGFREVVVDQRFAGKMVEVDILGGGHSTFQGTKFSDFAGGFSYRHKSESGKTIGKSTIQNRCIYWRTLNDTLELTEVSMDFNLVDNQVRYIFQDSPIVGPITIQETETTVVILVATVTSVNRFIFIHPTRVNEFQMEKLFVGRNKPSIFYQVTNKPQMTFRSFNIYENAINIPVPLSATCHYIERGPSYNQNLQLTSSITGECLFAFSFEKGSIHVYKISRDDTLFRFDLRQTNFLSRIFSGFAPSILSRGTNSSSSEAVIGLNFFTSKSDKERSAHLVTLSINGTLNLWYCPDLEAFTEWSPYHCGTVDPKFNNDGFTDSSMLLRKSQDQGANQLPVFGIYIPGEGFKIYNVVQNTGIGQPGITGTFKYMLRAQKCIIFKDEEVMDFSLSSDYIFTLANNPEEEMEWEIKYCLLKGDSTFTKAALEPLPVPDIGMTEISSEPKEFYMDVVFNKSTFSSDTIKKALSMFRKEDDDIIKDTDWESLRITAMNVIDREIGLETSNTEYDIADDDYTELSLKYWLMFYNSCVEYHIHTVKPLGLFFESNTRMLCVVKKCRISFLRPADLLETLHYFSDRLDLTRYQEDDEDDSWSDLELVTKYLQAIEIIENTVTENHKRKLEKRLRNNLAGVERACTEVTDLILGQLGLDFYSGTGESKDLLPNLGEVLAELGPNAERAMELTVRLVSTWGKENEILKTFVDQITDLESCNSTSQFFMGSRLGAHMTFRILKQMMEHRFLIARNTLLLQSLITGHYSQNVNSEEIRLKPSWQDLYEAFSATTTYYALLNIAEDSIETVSPHVKERGTKVANILKLHTSDHLSSDEYTDALWPTKIIEGFCLSKLGSLSIRNNVAIARSQKSNVLAHVVGAARCLCLDDENISSRPFEDFLIISCQYIILQKYARFLSGYLSNPNENQSIKRFYQGLSSLCQEESDTALQHFRSIDIREAAVEPYFSLKVLEIPIDFEGEIINSVFTSYFVKVISIFQIFELTSAVQKLAEDGLLSAADDEDAATKMCSLAFKCALSLDNYQAAYHHILRMPCYEQERKEKLASLRMFITKILRAGEMEILTSLDLHHMFNKTTSVREQVEQILFAQANLSDPLKKDGVYQMLFTYHLCKENYHKAAATMYYRAMRLGEKGQGFRGLKAQRDSYLDVLTCLNLIEKENFRYVIQKTGHLPQMPEPEICFDGSEVPVFSDVQTMILRQYQDVLREVELCCMLTKLGDTRPVKVYEFQKRAEQAVEALIIGHRYDDAIKLSKLWGINVKPIVSRFADVCCHLVYNIFPESGSPADYIKYNDISELPTTEAGLTEIAFRLLQSYMQKLENPKESDLHKEVTLKFLAADVELPHWLFASYKKLNVAQLLHCFIRYGHLERATDLSLKIIDATLGRINADEFDPTVRKITSSAPVDNVIPFTEINLLAGQIKSRLSEQPNLEEHYQLLKERSKLFCDRVLECTRRRNVMYTTEQVDYK